MGHDMVEADCEDQGMTNLSDGCFACPPSFSADGKSIRPGLVRVERFGKFWWCCERCEGSYGEARGAQPTEP